MSSTDVKIVCTDTISNARVNEYVYESFAKYDVLNKIMKFTDREFCFPDAEIIKNLTAYVNDAPVYCMDFTIVTEFTTAANLVEVYCTSTGGRGEYKPVKIFSGKFLK